MFDINKYYRPNQKIEPPQKKDWKRLYPDFCISELPGPAVPRNDSIKPGIRLAFDFIDDKYFVMDCSTSRKGYFYWGIGFFLINLLAVYSIIYGSNGDGKILAISLFSLFLGSPTIWCLILALFLPKEKKIIFDRNRGLVQLPGAFWDEPQLVNFSDLHATIAMRSRVGGLELTIARFKNWYDNLAGALYISFGYGKPHQSWSFFVWFMDKNRPLPPSETLDPFRERDFERRKSEGFPEPLFPSNIEIPEYNTKEFHDLVKQNNETPGSASVTLNDLYKKLEQNAIVPKNKKKLV